MRNSPNLNDPLLEQNIIYEGKNQFPYLLKQQEIVDLIFLLCQSSQSDVAVINMIDGNSMPFNSSLFSNVTSLNKESVYEFIDLHKTSKNSLIESISSHNELYNYLKDSSIGNYHFIGSYPLINNASEIFGTITIFNKSPKKLSSPEKQAIETVCNQFRMLIENKKRVNELNFFETIFNKSKEGFAWINKEAEIVNHNTGYSELTGFSKEFIANKKIYEYDPFFTEATWDLQWKNINGRKSLIFENEYLGQDQIIRTVELRLSLIEYNNESLISLIALDTSIKSKSLDKINENSFFLEKVQSIAKIGYWELDLKENEVYWSEETKRIHEVEPDFVPDLETGIDFYDMDSKPIISSKVEQAIANGESFDVQLKINTAKGKLKWVRSVGKASFENGKATKLIGVFQDITYDVKLKESLQLKRKQAEDASIAKDRFLSSMSHEIRTPLNGIIGTAYLLQNKNPKSEQLPYLEILYKSSKHLMSLLNNVLDFEKIEDRKIELEKINFDLKETLLNTIQPWLLMASEKGLAFDFTFDHKLSEFHVGDPTRIKQILNNLLSNAVKFTQRGTIKICIYLKEKLDENTVIEFIVEDTGLGIAKDKIKYIFSEFTQSEASTTRNYGGSGLGLSITQSLLHLMKSEIHVESTLGSGSRFSFLLTLPKSARPSALKSNPFNIFSPGKTLNNTIILLVEDNDFNQKIAKDYLETWGAKVVTAMDGREALALIESKAFDLILMDLQMPVMDGYTAARKIRKLKGSYFKKIPMLALTASALKSTHVKIMDAGMDQLLAKPLDPNELFQAIKKFTYQQNRESGVDYLISLEYFRSVSKDSGSTMKEYLELFIDVINEDIKELTKSLKKSDTMSVSLLIHKNKSALRTLGLDILTNKAEAFEGYLQEGKPLKEIRKEVEKFLKTDIQNTLNSLKKIKKFYN